MQTPISFALEILLDCETIEKAHKACRKYIKALEAGQAAPKITTSGFSQVIQSPSTQRLMEQHATPVQILTTAPMGAPTSARIVGGEVSTGGGTRGPRKY